MQLRTIFMLTPEEHAEQESVYQGIIERFGKEPSKWMYKVCSECSVRTGHAQTEYVGRLKEQVTELELSMILDRGYSYFGGSSRIFEDNSFCVVIYTD